MLSLSRCKEILGHNAEGFSDEEMLKVRDCLYELAHVLLEITAENIKKGISPGKTFGKRTWK